MAEARLYAARLESEPGWRMLVLRKLLPDSEGKQMYEYIVQSVTHWGLRVRSDNVAPFDLLGGVARFEPISGMAYDALLDIIAPTDTREPMLVIQQHRQRAVR